MAAVGSHIFLFGGRTGVEMGDGAQADLLAFDTESLAWSPVATAGSRPPPRSFHAMAAAGGRLWLFGGCGMAGRLCDLWCFTPGSAGPATGEWAQLPSCPGLGPRGGAVLAAAPDGSRLWVMGGFNGSELADVHEYETASGTWRCCCSSSTQATAAGKQEPTAAAEPDNASAPAIEPMPVGRSVFGAAAHGATAAPGCCSHRGHVVTFGGEVAPSDKGHAGAGSFCAATLCFAPAEAPGAGGGWHTVDAAGVGPGPRGWFAATSVGGGGLLVHGGLGADNERLGDMHLLTLH